MKNDISNHLDAANKTAQNIIGPGIKNFYLDKLNDEKIDQDVRKYIQGLSDDQIAELVLQEQILVLAKKPPEKTPEEWTGIKALFDNAGDDCYRSIIGSEVLTYSSLEPKEKLRLTAYCVFVIAVTDRIRDIKGIKDCQDCNS